MIKRIWDNLVRFGLGSPNEVLTKFCSLLTIRSSKNRKISLVITHYNRSDLIAASLRYAIFDRRIDEIVIYDDCSRDREYEWMNRRVRRMSHKVRVHRGAENLGAFCAKAKAIGMAKNDWAVLLDSDNVLSRSFVDKLFAIPVWNEQVIYCPEIAYPSSRFSQYSNIQIDSRGVRSFYRSDPKFCHFFNDGNYFVPVRPYVAVAHKVEGGNLLAADVAALNLAWINAGFSLRVVPGLSYFHRVHGGSYWLSNEKGSNQVLEKLLSKPLQ